MKNTFNDRVKAEAARRRLKVRKMRERGLSVKAIAGRLGVTDKRVYQLLGD